jgi:AcrR family transcriptional regulator
MPESSLRADRAALVRERVLDGVAAVLAAGDDLTFARVAGAAGVPERTVYRHFPTRADLFRAVFDRANEQIGFDGEIPVDADGATALVRRVFPGFDDHAPVVRELLAAPEGSEARLADADARRRAALDLVRHEVPGLTPTAARRVAAAAQLLTVAATWQTLRDYWGMDGKEAAETAALALELLLDGARARADDPRPSRRSHR